MKKKIAISLLSIAAIIILFSFTHKNKEAPIAYPEGFRHWERVKSYVVSPDNPASPKYEGFNHVYANPEAIKGYATGKFPDGSIIVMDVVEKATTKNGTGAGKRKFIDVMIRNSKLYAESGGWGFQEFFDSSGKTGVLTPAAQQKCFSCHASQKERDYVFTKYENQ